MVDIDSRPNPSKPPILSFTNLFLSQKSTSSPIIYACGEFVTIAINNEASYTLAAIVEKK